MAAALSSPPIFPHRCSYLTADHPPSLLSLSTVAKNFRVSPAPFSLTQRTTAVAPPSPPILPHCCSYLTANHPLSPLLFRLWLAGSLRSVPRVLLVTLYLLPNASYPLLTDPPPLVYSSPMPPIARNQFPTNLLLLLNPPQRGTSDKGLQWLALMSEAVSGLVSSNRALNIEIFHENCVASARLHLYLEAISQKKFPGRSKDERPNSIADGNSGRSNTGRSQSTAFKSFGVQKKDTKGFLLDLKDQQVETGNLQDATFLNAVAKVKVKRRGDDTKYVAKVLARGVECDIALLSVESKEFWKGAEPLHFGRLPRLQVVLLGYNNNASKALKIIPCACDHQHGYQNPDPDLMILRSYDPFEYNRSGSCKKLLIASKRYPCFIDWTHTRDFEDYGEVRMSQDWILSHPLLNFIEDCSCIPLELSFLHTINDGRHKRVPMSNPLTVVGYPLGGDTISVTKGVVSRIEVTSYAHGSSELLGIQIDAAINPGNSGGPAFNDQGECIGVAFQVYRSEEAENIGYVIPTTVVSHFLEDYERNGKYTGFPCLGVLLQKLENPALRACLKVPSNEVYVIVYTKSAFSSFVGDDRIF
ncbi:hypothetical protein TEA_010959 [Camellia sinensis var. sinensis]|uniref:Protease Do-like PDZ domain-containing protein n=1 Tax=Camellia sinensis var. sinensis TaxID=542762 RepID=A0A4S4D5P9_CAMSN|nr:hypothetical protein TEA_010959 [Camellia sinensis var. sinensis]